MKVKIIRYKKLNPLLNFLDKKKFGIREFEYAENKIMKTFRGIKFFEIVIGIEKIKTKHIKLSGGMI